MVLESVNAITVPAAARDSAAALTVLNALSELVAALGTALAQINAPARGGRGGVAVIRGEGIVIAREARILPLLPHPLQLRPLLHHPATLATSM
ncbi:MAG: hypothetical protein QW687_00490 [Candidatus Hadarchaeales archaeon]